MCYSYLSSVEWLGLVCTLWLCVGFCWSSHCVYGRYVGVWWFVYVGVG